MEEKKQVFEYNYSAKQQEEVRRIREKYVPKEESKLEQLKKLDAHATRSGDQHVDSGCGHVLYDDLGGWMVYSGYYHRMHRHGGDLFGLSVV